MFQMWMQRWRLPLLQGGWRRRRCWHWYRVAIAQNNIGTSGQRQAVRAYVKDSGITSSGALSLSATGDMEIDAGVGAGSMALSGGAGGGVSGAGAGVSTTNEIYTDVTTYIDNSLAKAK
ncbi:hypothetical protein [Vibrio taketomensis]|uniref:hypothetical protein n=1 Tax=Vibrio taketomensis TaxID=2572923 RepID=UPI0013899737|nr:hypothetical protein [Vibrio taketomensis]